MSRFLRSYASLEISVMASSARIFFAGVGTTFLILGVGFGGGLFMANSALKEPTGYQAKVKAEPSPAVRVVLPTTAEAAHPDQQLAPQQVATVEPPPAPSPEEVKAAPPEKVVEKVETKKAEMEVRARRKRYAERKARREYRARQQVEPRVREEAPVMAFGGDGPRQTASFGLFGNN
jgi:type IV secretory pathway VirB10-like protein